MIARAVRWGIRNWKIRTNPINYARSIGVKIGNNCTLLAPTSSTFGTEPYLVSMGDNVVITPGVRFITHDGSVLLFRHEFPGIDLISPIIIGSNVYIGVNAIILRGVRIGDKCIIGAGSVVTKNVPSGYVAAGNPAQCIKSFDEYRESMLKRALYIHTTIYRERQMLLEQIFGERSSNKKK